jgi:type II secretory pathway pseudopilin PulG
MHLAGQARTISTTPERESRPDGGYAMAVLLVSMSVMAIMLTVVMPVWKQTAQREKEAELVFRGEQYARAIGLFQKKYANAFPPNLDLLVEQKFLRKKYKDPITNSDFVPLLQGQGAAATPGSGSQTAARPGQTPTPAQNNPATGPRPPSAATPARPTPGGVGTPGAGATGGISGVASKSKDTSIRLYKGRSHYNEWAFVFIPQVQAPAAAGTPNAPGGGPGGPGTGRPGGPGTGRPGGPGTGRPGGPGTGGPGGPGGPNGPGGRFPGGNPFPPPNQPRPPGR